jgi:lipopolysaccharide/colanic/teichoic acid biosynthesis glycosyltransferase
MTKAVKRALDIAISLVGLLVTLPVIGIVMLLLSIESPRHIFFAQTRLGLKGRPFNMYKFRKLPVNWTDEGPGVTVAFDSRMTKLGAFLERTKIDELPQLWNILKGDMSIVGPRPESLKFKDLFVGEYAELLRFKPGIFGPNQVKYRNEAELYPPDVPPEKFYREVLFPEKARRDLDYFRKTNPFRDLLLILKGVWATFSGIISWRRILNLHLRIVVADVLMIEAAWFLAHLTRYSGLPPESEWEIFLFGIWFLPPFLIAGMALFGCYRNPARFFYVPDAIRLIMVNSFLWLIFFIILFIIHRSLSVYIIPLVAAFLIIFEMLPRVALKFFWEMKPLDQQKRSTSHVLIYGAGRIGTSMSGLINGRASAMELVGFVDDNPYLRGRRVHGFEVLGRESDLPTIHAVHKFDEIWMTFKPDEIKRLRMMAFCQKQQVKLTILAETEPFSRIFAD